MKQNNHFLLGDINKFWFNYFSKHCSKVGYDGNGSKFKIDFLNFFLSWVSFL